MARNASFAFQGVPTKPGRSAGEERGRGTRMLVLLGDELPRWADVVGTWAGPSQAWLPGAGGRRRGAGGPRPWLLVTGRLTGLLPRPAPAGLSCDRSGSFFPALRTSVAAMFVLPTVFLLLALRAFSLAEPVSFKDCGEPHGSPRGLLRPLREPPPNPAENPGSRLGGSLGRPGSALDP